MDSEPWLFSKRDQRGGGVEPEDGGGATGDADAGGAPVVVAQDAMKKRKGEGKSARKRGRRVVEPGGLEASVMDSSPDIFSLEGPLERNKFNFELLEESWYQDDKIMKRGQNQKGEGVPAGMITEGEPGERSWKGRGRASMYLWLVDNKLRSRDFFDTPSDTRDENDFPPESLRDRESVVADNSRGEIEVLRVGVHSLPEPVSDIDSRLIEVDFSSTDSFQKMLITG